MTTQRYHFLDGLRGVAMLLGIVLHASMTFRGWDVWGVEEVSVAPEFFGWVFDFIHGFRMQLFFVVSGFFTMMLAKRRGLVSLLKQRLLRIVVPLVVGTLILSPMIYVLSAWGEERGRVHAAPEEADENLLAAAAIGDADRVAEWIEQGADLEVRGDNEETPLISAAFFGRVDCVELLLGAGADMEAKDRWGTNSMKAATMDFKIVKGIAESFGLEADREGREICARLLKEAGASGETSELKKGKWAEFAEEPWIYVPVFHHLWFLYYLCWLLLAFFILVKLPWRLLRWPDRLVDSPWAMIWILPLTWYFQILMPWQVGPGTATGIVPHWPKMGYYAVFFFFGVLCYGRSFVEERLGRRWPLWLSLSVPCLWLAREWQWWAEMQIWAQLAAVCYAWLMIAVSFGIFRRFCNGGNSAFRYLSDASYWLYLAHLPMIMVLAILTGDWEISGWFKFPFVILATTIPLLVIYEYVVRYTWIGALLHGRKSRVKPPTLPEVASSKRNEGL